MVIKGNSSPRKKRAVHFLETFPRNFQNNGKINTCIIFTHTDSHGCRSRFLIAANTSEMQDRKLKLSAKYLMQEHDSRKELAGDSVTVLGLVRTVGQC